MQSQGVLRPAPPARSHNISRVVHAVKRFIPGWHGRFVACRVKSTTTVMWGDVDEKARRTNLSSSLSARLDSLGVRACHNQRGGRRLLAHVPILRRMTRTAFPAAAIQSGRAPFWHIPESAMDKRWGLPDLRPLTGSVGQIEQWNGYLHARNRAVMGT
jgi:hypothetical protein